MSSELQINILYIYTLLRCIVGVVCICVFNQIACENDILLKINICWVIATSVLLTKFNIDFTETIIAYMYWFIIEIGMLYHLQSCKYTIWYIYPIFDLTLFSSLMIIYCILRLYYDRRYIINNPELSIPMIDIQPLSAYNQL